MPNKDFTDITVVLDRSGSMAFIADDTIGGFNAFIDEQKKTPGRAALTLVQFDHEYDFVHKAVAVGEVPHLTSQTFIPRGYTALLDAIGRAIVETGERLSGMAEGERPGYVVFAIVTDGQENSSKEYTRDKVLSMISHQRAAYQWDFVFLGANQDAIKVAGGIGIAAGNAMTYAANSQGTPMAFAAASAGMAANRVQSAEGCTLTDYFDDNAREKQREAGAKS